MECQKILRYYVDDWLENVLLLICLLTYGWNLPDVYKTGSQGNPKVLQYGIWTSVKRSVKELSSKRKFRTFLHLK